MKEVHLSIVSPVYRAEKIIPLLVERISQNAQKITDSYEIILVEDCGPDASWEVMEKLAATNDRIKAIKLSRNFGQHYAITAGLDHARGEWIIVMDCDLQDVPEEIPALYRKAQEGFDVVLARRAVRKDNYFKRLFSAAFYRTLGYLTGSDQDESIANYGIYNHKVIAAVVSMRESIRYFPTMIKWVGFKTVKMDVVHDHRADGKSSYNFGKLLRLATDIILAYSDKPIRIMVRFGLLISFASFLFALRLVYLWMNNRIEILGYTSLIVSIWLLSGLIISTLGIVGLYIGKTFEGVKKRPIYIIDKIVANGKA
jgi:polyisoprenyl-phosphate glycosyltransferase